MEAKIESTNTLPTTASDSDDEMWKNGAITIFKPINDNIIAKPYFKRLNIWMKFESKK